MWRKGWFGGEDVTLCNACGLRYKKGKFCLHCKEIYYEDEDKRPYGKGSLLDCKNSWLGCSHCARWSHLKCCLKEAGPGGLPRCPWPSCRHVPGAMGSPTSVLASGVAASPGASPGGRGAARTVNFGLRHEITWTHSVSALERARWRAETLSRTRNSVIIM